MHRCLKLASVHGEIIFFIATDSSPRANANILFPSNSGLEEENCAPCTDCEASKLHKMATRDLEIEMERTKIALPNEGNI